MRTTKLLIQKNGAVSLMEASTPIGYSGEHNAVVFLLGLSEEIMQYFGNPSYFRFVINGWYSEPVYPINNEISYCLPQSCLTPPKINCQIIGYVISEGVPKEISKSAVFELEVGFSEGMLGQFDAAPNAMEAALARCEKFENDSANNAALATKSSEAASDSAKTASDAATQAQENAKKAQQVLNDMETAADSGRFDGFSPVANVAEIGGGVAITITDRSGTTTEPLYHGISPDLRRCLRFIGDYENKAELPDSAMIGDVYSVGGAKLLFNGSLSQNDSTVYFGLGSTSFDVYAKTDGYTCGGESVLYLISNGPEGNGFAVSNFEGQNTLYLHFEIENGIATVTGERVYSEGAEYESRNTISEEITLSGESNEFAFFLNSGEEETENGLRFSGPGLSVLKITANSKKGDGILYLFDGACWLPFSPEIENIETALDKIIEIQNSLIGGENV